MARDLAGASVLVTGASTGIGAALAVDLGREGAHVGLVARRGELLDEVLEQARAAGAGERSRRWAVDLGDLEATEQMAHEAWDHFGGLAGIVNNAAIPKVRHVTQLNPDELELVMRVNFLSPARIILTLLPHLLEQGHGTVVNVASLAGRIGNPFESAYSASKFALTGFSEALAVDLGGTGLDIRLVQPGPIDTPIWNLPGEEPGHYKGPKFPPSDVSLEIVRVLQGEGGFETIVPANFANVITYKNGDIDGYLKGAAAFVANELSTAVAGAPESAVPEALRG